MEMPQTHLPACSHLPTTSPPAGVCPQPRAASAYVLPPAVEPIPNVRSLLKTGLLLISWRIAVHTIALVVWRVQALAFVAWRLNGSSVVAWRLAALEQYQMYKANSSFMPNFPQLLVASFFALWRNKWLLKARQGSDQSPQKLFWQPDCSTYQFRRNCHSDNHLGNIKDRWRNFYHNVLSHRNPSLCIKKRLLLLL